jgi:class 3 adenylate cyclase
MKFSRTARVLMPFIISVILVLVCIYTIPYWHSNVTSKTFFLKIFSVLAVSLVTLILSLLIRGYINISLTVIGYGILSTGVISYISYVEISKHVPTHSDVIIPLALLLIPAAILPELYKRMTLRRLAQWCLGGRRLEDYSRSPWSFLDERKKKLLSILYFDTPELNNMADKLEPDVLKRILNHILGHSIRICSQHNGIFVRHTEDSLLIAFEPSEKYGKLNTTEAYSAYHSVLCGMALKQMIEEVKETIQIPEIKKLQGRVIIATDDGMILHHIRRGTMELSLFSNAMHTIGTIIPFSDGEDIIIDPKTHELCSDYFLTKAISARAHLVLGISGYYK